MTRPLQHRDISTPIERIVRDWADRNDVSALRYSELTQALVDEVNDLVRRAYGDGQQDVLDRGHKAVVEISDTLAYLRGHSNKDGHDLGRVVGMEDALRMLRQAMKGEL